LQYNLTLLFPLLLKEREFKTLLLQKEKGRDEVDFKTIW
jgi:hypothetical protein